MSTTPSEEPTQYSPGPSPTHATQPTMPLPGEPLEPQGAYAPLPDAGAYAAQYSYPVQAATYSVRAPVSTTVKDTNAFALVSIILTFMVPLAGIIFGHLGLNQIKRTGDGGRGLALTAVIYGYCMFALGLLFAIIYIGFISVAIGAMSSGSYY